MTTTAAAPSLMPENWPQSPTHILEGRFHPGQIFHGDAKTGMLILGKLFDLLAGPDFQRQDFVKKLPALIAASAFC